MNNLVFSTSLLSVRCPVRSEGYSFTVPKTFEELSLEGLKYAYTAKYRIAEAEETGRILTHAAESVVNKEAVAKHLSVAGRRDRRMDNSSMPPAPPMESAMATGQGSDDEPSFSIGDRHSGEAVPDPDGDRHLTSAKAASLLGAAPILPPIDGTNTIGDLDLSTLFGPPNVAVPDWGRLSLLCDLQGENGELYPSRAQPVPGLTGTPFPISRNQPASPTRADSVCA